LLASASNSYPFGFLGEPTNGLLPENLKARDGDVGRPIPGKVFQHVSAGGFSPFPCLGWLRHDATHVRLKHRRVRFGEPGIIDGFCLAEALLWKAHRTSRDQKGVLVVTKIERGTIARHDHR